MLIMPIKVARSGPNILLLQEQQQNKRHAFVAMLELLDVNEAQRRKNI